MTKKDYLKTAEIMCEEFEARGGVYAGKSEEVAESILKAKISTLKDCLYHENMKNETVKSVADRISAMAGKVIM